MKEVRKSERPEVGKTRDGKTGSHSRNIMRHSPELLKKIDDSQALLKQMAIAVSLQGIKAEPLNYVQEGLTELSSIVENGEILEPLFVMRWDRMMGWVPRYFEGHPLVDLLEEIDKMLGI